jgi:hypothetical protein
LNPVSWRGQAIPKRNLQRSSQKSGIKKPKALAKTPYGLEIAGMRIKNTP